MSAPASAGARLFVRLRLVVILAWIAGTVWAVIALPTISRSGASTARPLVPRNAPAVKAERLSAARFKFPLLSRTLVVIRNPRGLSPSRQTGLVRLADQLSVGHVPGFGAIAGAIPLINTVGAPPFARERGTTAILYLYFRRGPDASVRTQTANRLLRTEIGHRRGEFEGVTGQVPGRVARTGLIASHLKWVELATILLVALAIGIHFRGAGAALLTIVVVVIAYLLADRLVAELGRASGIQVPADIEPVLVVLVFGVATDYTVFFLSRFRGLLAAGHGRREAAAWVSREITPIVMVAGTTVAVGTAALLVARLEFVRAFGPGLAVAVMIAMIISITLVPAVLATFGAGLFWPRGQPTGYPGGAQAFRDSRGASNPGRTVRIAARYPAVALLVALAIVLGSASGLLRLALGNELILGLPSASTPHRAYAAAARGFAPGVLGPTIVLVTGPNVVTRASSLEPFGKLLSRQPGVTQVLGPGQQPSRRGFGAAIWRAGDAARYVLFLGSDPLGARAISEIRSLNGRLPALLRRSGLGGARALLAGDTALSADTVETTIGDLGRVTPTVLAAIFVVVAIFLRALVAPLYLVVTSALASLASLGLTVYVMQTLLGFGQITYYVIFIVAILLVALGSDYNVFLVGRIWQEGRRRPIRDAIEVAGTRAARPITTAGFVLALSFALLAIVPLRSFREIAFGMAAGLIIDAFVVRTILVPALIALVGPKSAWPGHKLRSEQGPALEEAATAVTADGPATPAASSPRIAK